MGTNRGAQLFIVPGEGNNAAPPCTVPAIAGLLLPRSKDSSRVLEISKMLGPKSILAVRDDRVDFGSVQQISMKHALDHCVWMFVISLAAITLGCSKAEPIVTYTIPTKLPEQLEPQKDRMLASIVPLGEKVWFFKVTGPETAIEEIEESFKEFVAGVKFKSGKPDLKELPEGWRRAGEKPMRYASIDVTTPTKQLDISISNLPRPPESVSPDWNNYVSMNINRWRGQLGLDPSEEKWAGAETMDVAAADGDAIWFDKLGEPGGGKKSMMPPFAGGGPMAPFAASQGRESTNGGPKESPKSRFKFDRPDGWRDGRMSSMRWAAFNVGPEESPAEVTVMPAGGDLRGNVARWIGQVLGESPEAKIVDKALADASKLDVDGRQAQRFLLTGKDPDAGTAIDATIVPMDGGVSMFIKMTGPVATVTDQRDSLGSFLQSLRF